VRKADGQVFHGYVWPDKAVFPISCGLVCVNGGRFAPQLRSALLEFGMNPRSTIAPSECGEIWFPSMRKEQEK